MEELCQPTLDGRGGPIAPIAIQATNFGLKNDMIQQVQNSCLFHGLGDDANKHLAKFLHVTQSIHRDTINAAAGGTFMKRRPEECYDLITTMIGILPLKGVSPPEVVLLYKGPTIPTTSSSPKVVERETEVTKDTVPPTNNGGTEDVQPPFVQVETQVPNFEPVVAPVIEPVEAPVSAPKPNSKPSIPYPSRLNDQTLREKANNQMEKFFQIFQDLHFDISFTDALILMPKFASTIKSLLSNKEKLFELARTPLNEHCLAVFLKKLPQKLRALDKFLIPCDFLGMDVCLALADLGASINLMPLFRVEKRFPFLNVLLLLV
ncbi:hypothetical protein Tco_0012797 [Tanacetum coccineum]